MSGIGETMKHEIRTEVEVIPRPTHCSCKVERGVSGITFSNEIPTRFNVIPSSSLGVSNTRSFSNEITARATATSLASSQDEEESDGDEVNDVAVARFVIPLEELLVLEKPNDEGIALKRVVLSLEELILMKSSSSLLQEQCAALLEEEDEFLQKKWSCSDARSWRLAEGASAARASAIPPAPTGAPASLRSARACSQGGGLKRRTKTKPRRKHQRARGLDGVEFKWTFEFPDYNLLVLL